MQADIFIDYPYELFSYMREIRKPVFHNSNVYVRDVQYAIQDYFEDKTGEVVKNAEIDRVAMEVIRGLEAKGILKRVNPQGYLVNYPEMLTGKDGTKGPLGISIGATELPPAASAQSAAASTPAATAKLVAPPPMKAAAPSASAVTGAAPTGAKAPPPWLKK